MPTDNIEFQIKETLKKHSGLSFDDKSRMFSGILAVDEGDYYSVIIDITCFPDNFPVVRETSERIRPIANNHINSDGSCCFTVPVKEQLLLRKRLVKTIPQFIEKIVIPFFQNNSYKEITGHYKEGEYSHGIPGIIEAYSDILRTTDHELTQRVLIHFLKGRGYGKNDSCYCGSNKKFKDCHQYKFNDLKLIGKEIILNDMKSILKV
jgi:hypothetical protein